MKKGKYVVAFLVVLVLRYMQSYGSYMTSTYNPDADFKALDHNAKLAAGVNALVAAILLTIAYWAFSEVFFKKTEDENVGDSAEEVEEEEREETIENKQPE